VSGALRRLVAVALAFALALFAASAAAGVMTRDLMLKAFPSPLIVGERDATLPVWPIFKQDATATPLIGYVFESIDLAPIPGFAGTPFNLLIALDASGTFIDVQVLAQHEPVFVDGLGPAPLHRFVEQYKGLSLKQNIRIGSNTNRAAGDGANVVIDGVAKATASVRILNQTLLAASLKVARARLGFAEGRDPDLIARIRDDVFSAADWNALSRAELITHQRFPVATVDAAFAGTVGEGQAAASGLAADANFVELFLAHLNVPGVGRNLLSPRDWERLQQRLEAGDHALFVATRGAWTPFGDDFVRGAVPDRLTLRQGELPIEMRDLDLDVRPLLPPELAGAEWKIFRVIAPAGLDPSLPLEYSLHVTRSKGVIYPEKVQRSFRVDTRLPAAYYRAAEADNKTWHTLWADRAGEIAVLVGGLALLATGLVAQRRSAADFRRLRRLRAAYLLFTLVFVGWHAQGQLSIVNITGALQAALAGRSLQFLLFDPMSVILWGFVLLTFFVWGRGTFCGWLCPFGALQEFVSLAAQRLGLRQRRVPEQVDRALKRLKYAVLAVILAVAAYSVTWTDRLVEVEPFKTAITLHFVRDWPYVAWAALALAASAFVYKAYCRYLCPLGAGMALLGRLRIFDWLPRRKECGSPCQRCRHDCEYQAIHRNGRIDYNECFQCLDCVAIHDSDALCPPLMNARRQVLRRMDGKGGKP